MLKKLSVFTSNQEVGVLTSKTISNKLLLNAYNAFNNNSGSNSLIFELTSNEASISLYDEDTDVKTNVIELNNNFINIPGNITFDGNINSISKNELNTLLNNDNNIKETFTSHATNITNTSNHILAIDTKFITNINTLDTRITDNDTDISALDTRITDNDTDITALDTRIINNVTDIFNTSNYLNKIETKTSNIEVIESGNIKLNSDLTITGELTVTDLNVTGSSTQINTTTYETENLQINNSQGDGPSLKIDHKNDDDDILQIFNDTTRLFTIDPIGNVGIFNNDPQYSLDVTGNINFTGNLTQGGSAFTSYTDSDVLNLLSTKGGDGISWNAGTSQFDNDITQYQDSDVTSLLNTGITGGLKVTSGNIGIGVSNPKEKLSINGKIAFQGGTFNDTTFLSYYYGTQDTEREILLFTGGKTILRAVDFDYGSDISGVFIQTYDGTSRISIVNSGNVGIGTTSPNHKLDVNGDINISSGSSFKINGSAIATTDTTYIGGTGISISGTTINSQITQYSNSDVETLLSTNAIKIGIGITAHSTATLVIKGETIFEGTDRNTNINYSTDEHTYIRGGKNTSYVLLNDNGGNVGVGTVTPGYTLDVTGDINFTGNLTQGGSAFTSYTDSDVTTLLNSGITGGLKVTNGNVGIGISPSYKLDIDGDINISSGSSFKINGVTIATTDTTYTGGTGITIDGTTINCDIVDTTVLVSDTTPQLGGNLDVNEKDIISATDKNINIDPAGNGDFVIKGNATRGSGSIKLNCENNSHGIKIKGPPHSAGASYTLTLPDNVGTANQLLSTDGSGSLSFITPASSYTNSDVTALLNSGVSGGIVSLNDLTVHGNLTSISTGDPVIVPIVPINDNGNFKTVIFENTGNNESIYDITFSSDTICDILIVAGGGSGGQYGGGGGGGDVLHFENITLNGNYNIKVGKGGYGNTRDNLSHGGGYNGFNSSIIGGVINIIAGGGGGGAGYGNYNNDAKALSGTSVSYINPITGLSYTSSGGGGGTIFVNNEFASGNTVSGDGATNLGSNHAGGGGGGAGGILDGSIGDAPDKPAANEGGDGGIGLASDISGVLTEYGGGGGGGDWTGPGRVHGSGVYGGGDGGTIPGNGLSGTGGGGGGRRTTGSADDGQGGSGIVIIKYSSSTKIIEINNGSLKFSDGSQISSGLYIFKGNLLSISNINTSSWSNPQIFSSTKEIYNVGGFTYHSQGIVVPSTGYYDCIANIRMKNINVDMVSVEVSIYVNGVISGDNERICGSYVRFASGDDGSKCSNGSFLHYFSQGDKVSLGFLATCLGSSATLQGEYSTFSLRKVG